MNPNTKFIAEFWEYLDIARNMLIIHSDTESKIHSEIIIDITGNHENLFTNLVLSVLSINVHTQLLRVMTVRPK